MVFEVILFVLAVLFTLAFVAWLLSKASPIGGMGIFIFSYLILIALYSFLINKLLGEAGSEFFGSFGELPFFFVFILMIVSLRAMVEIREKLMLRDLEKEKFREFDPLKNDKSTWKEIEYIKKHNKKEFKKSSKERKEELNRQLFAACRNRSISQYMSGGSSDLIELLKRGADVNARESDYEDPFMDVKEGQYGKTPLMTLHRNGAGYKAAILAACGADVNAKDEYKRTPLMFMAEESDTATYVLLNAGADIKAKDDEGKTPLMYHIIRDTNRPYDPIARLRWTEVLIKLSNINEKDKDGNTALHHAVDGDLEWAVDKLLRRGADPMIKNKKRKTAIDIAHDNINDKLEKKLRKFIEKKN